MDPDAARGAQSAAALPQCRLHLVVLELEDFIPGVHIRPVGTRVGRLKVPRLVHLGRGKATG